MTYQRIPTRGPGRGNLIPTYGYGNRPEDDAVDLDLGILKKKKFIRKEITFNLTAGISQNKESNLDLTGRIFKKLSLDYNIKIGKSFIKEFSYNLSASIEKSLETNFHISAGINKRLDCQYRIIGKSDKRKLIRLLKAM